MVVIHSLSLSEYSKVLENNQEEVNVLVKEILIGVTNFFRDPAFFEKLKQKVDELSMTTNDLSNFLSSTMIGIIFVDSNLNIRKFTRRMISKSNYAVTPQLLKKEAEGVITFETMFEDHLLNH